MNSLGKRASKRPIVLPLVVRSGVPTQRSGARAQRSGAQRSGARAQRSGARAQRSGARARITPQTLEKPTTMVFQFKPFVFDP